MTSNFLCLIFIIHSFTLAIVPISVNIYCIKYIKLFFSCVSFLHKMAQIKTSNKMCCNALIKGKTFRYLEMICGCVGEITVAETGN